MDAPELYKSKIKYILDNNVEDLQLTFTQEEETSPGKELFIATTTTKKYMHVGI